MNKIYIIQWFGEYVQCDQKHSAQLGCYTDMVLALYY